MFSASLLVWVRALHIIFMVCWFAGIFYLPRLFVNHAMTEDATTRACFRVMEQKLYRFMTPFAWLTVAPGVWMLAAGWEAYRTQGWMLAKLVLVGLLVAYHLTCGHFVRVFSDERNTRSHVFFRWFNELPVLILFSIVILVIVKPVLGMSS